MKIAWLYQRTYGEEISSWKVEGVIERHGLDFHPERVAKTRRKRKRVFTAIDDHTRIGYARMYKAANSRNTSDFLQRLLYLLSVPIHYLHTDNGSEFSRYFSQLLKSLHIPQYFSWSRMPKDNPRLERLHRTLREEWSDFGQMGEDLEEVNASLTEWLVTYNAVRPHQSLGHLTPLEFAEEYTQVLPMYSSSTQA